MSLFGCRCLNVALTASAPPERPATHGRPAPPSPDAFPCQAGAVDSCNVCCKESSLLEAKEADSWTVYRCMVCSTVTHATHTQPPYSILLNMSLITSNDEIASLRNSDTYSPVFKILLCDNDEDPPTKKIPSTISHPAIGNLSKRLTRDLQSKLESTEEEIRLFREKKYNELEEYKERAHSDFKILTNVICRDSSNFVTDKEKHVQVFEPSNVVPSERSIINKKQHSSNRTNPVTFRKIKNDAVKNLVNIDTFKEDSLDSEGIFDIEGMDDTTSPHIDHNSDGYDSESDDSGSRDEGFHRAHIPNQQWKMSIAKSLPVDVPVFAHAHEHSQEQLNQNLDEPHDIATSIKKLARSVHGDVFGDLPRPRFSTQI